MKYLILALATTSFYYAQLNFYEGYIITNEGDTIKGEVKANPKKELSLFSKVLFKDKQGFSKTYKPDKIKGFAYYNSIKNKWHVFISVKQNEYQFYKIAIQHPVLIYEYQYEDMKVGGEFYTAKEYYIQEDNEFIRLKPKKMKKQLSEYIRNTNVLDEMEKMEDIDIEKLSYLLEQHYSKSSS